MVSSQILLFWSCIGVSDQNSVQCSIIQLTALHALGDQQSMSNVYNEKVPKDHLKLSQMTRTQSVCRCC
jgi:hypothetical protein